MTDLPLRVEAVAAAKVASQRLGYSIGRSRIEAILRAFCEAEGLVVVEGGPLGSPFDSYSLRGPWRPLPGDLVDALQVGARVSHEANGKVVCPDSGVDLGIVCGGQ